MPKNSAPKKKELDKLFSVVDSSPEIDWRKINLNDASSLSPLKLGRTSAQKKNMLENLKKYQRLLKIKLVDNKLIYRGFLEQDLHSALQIATIPRKQFTDRFLDLFDGKKEVLESFYRRALQIRSQVLINFMNRTQQ